MNDDKLIRLYGEFLMRFELVCSGLRLAILTSFYPNYEKAEIRKIEILLEGLAADQLRRKFLALVIEDFSKNSKTYENSKKISDIFEKYLPIRNSFSHGTAILYKLSPLLQEPSTSKLKLKHSKLTKDGLDFNFKEFDETELSLHVNNLQYLNNALELTFMMIKSYEKETKIFKVDFFDLIANNLNNINKTF